MIILDTHDVVVVVGHGHNHEVLLWVVMQASQAVWITPIASGNKDLWAAGPVTGFCRIG